MTCDTLRSIRPGALKLGSRECEWFPVAHDRPPTHKQCGGQVSQLATGIGEDVLWSGCACKRDCDDSEVDKGPCAGEKRAIVSKPGER